jgi:hypothetical protein
MAEHSKGIWHPAQVTEGDTWVETEEPAGEFRPIAEMLGHYWEPSGREEMMANARLMAAAPDLLAACDELLDLFNDMSDETRDRFDEDLCGAHLCIGAVRERAEAAIAKAKGGA